MKKWKQRANKRSAKCCSCPNYKDRITTSTSPGMWNDGIHTYKQSKRGGKSLVINLWLAKPQPATFCPKSIFNCEQHPLPFFLFFPPFIIYLFFILPCYIIRHFSIWIRILCNQRRKKRRKKEEKKKKESDFQKSTFEKATTQEIIGICFYPYIILILYVTRGIFNVQTIFQFFPI